MKKIFVFILFGGLTACGGGGGGSSGNPASPAPTISITTTNAPEVTSTAMSSDSVTTNIGGVSVLTAGSSPSGATLTLSDFTRRVLGLDQYQKLQVQTDVSASLCTGGGSADLTGNNSSGTLVFAACNNGVFVVDGTISYTITTTQNGYTANVVYSNFTFTDSTTSISVTVNASLSLSYMTNGSGGTATTSITNFDMNFGSDYVHLYNMTMTVVTDASGNTSTDFDYTFESSFINGIVRVTTAASEGGQSIHQNYLDPYPDSGAFVVIGDSSRARVTFLGDGSASSTVSLEVDTDGDGVYDNSLGPYSLAVFTGMSLL